MKLFDIETAPMPAEKLQLLMPKFEAAKNIKDPEKIATDIAKKESAFIAKAALSPTTGTVLAYGIYDDEAEDYYSADITTGSSEAAMISIMWERLTSDGAFTDDVAGWNLNGFDIPFIIKRSWANRVKVPSSAIEWYRGRSYLNGRFKDLMEYFCLGSSTDRFIKLDSALDLLGLPRKVDLDGKLPYDIFESEPERFHEYLQRDVMALKDISTAVGL